jgi:valyl-tRNA synthetase
MSLRVQGFEIIRTWLFYTLVQSHLLVDRIPWRSVMVSGWGLNEQGRKIAKRDLAPPEGGSFNRYAPDQVIERYGADALRLWATRARLGGDLRYHEKDVRTGRKFVVKLWNVARFAAMNLGAAVPPPAPPVAGRTAVDRWVLSHLAEAVDEVTAALDRFDYAHAHQAASRFFWSVYCDRYVEMVKDRFLDVAAHPDAERDSARATLWESLRVLLALFAPFAPFITEHLYQRHYRAHEAAASLHRTAWPVAEASWRTDRADIDRMAAVLDQVRVLRSRRRLGAGTRVSALVLHAASDEARALAAAIREPLRAAARADHVRDGQAAHDTGVPGLRVDIIA